MWSVRAFGLTSQECKYDNYSERLSGKAQFAIKFNTDWNVIIYDDYIELKQL